MNKLQNPFTPGAGIRPQVIVGRDALIDEADQLFARTIIGKVQKSIIFAGLRGTGKTVLLNHVARNAEKQNYIVAFIEISRKDDFICGLGLSLQNIINSLSEFCKNDDNEKLNIILKENLDFPLIYLQVFLYFLHDFP